MKGSFCRRRRILALTLLLLLLAPSLDMSANVEAQTIDEVAKLAAEGNPGLASLREQMSDLKSEIPGKKLLEKFAVTIAPSWYQDSTGGNPGASLSVSGPIIPQLSVNATYDFDAGEGDFSVALHPFAKGEDQKTWRADLESLNAKYAEEAAKVRFKAESFYISMVLCLGRRDIAAARFSISETLYKGAVFKYESGLLSYKNFKESFQDYQQWLQDLLKAERELIDLKKNALDLFGSVAALDSAPSWSISDDALSQRNAALEAALAKAGNPTSAELFQLEASLRKMEREQVATNAWQPEISLGATTESNFGSVDASIGLTFSLDQVKTNQKAKLESKIQFKRQDVERKRLGLGYTVRMLKLQSETLKEGISIYRNAVKSADGAYAEAQVRHKAGYLDNESLESARLDTVDARLSLLQASAELLSSLRDLQLNYLYLFADGGY